MDTTDIVLATEAFQGMSLAFGCCVLFALGWIGGHQR